MKYFASSGFIRISLLLGLSFMNLWLMLPPLKLEEYVFWKKKQNKTVLWALWWRHWRVWAFTEQFWQDDSSHTHRLNAERAQLKTVLTTTGYVIADRRSLTLCIYSISHGYTYNFVVTQLKNYKERASRCKGSICFPFWLSDCDKSTTSPPDAVYVCQIKRAPPPSTVYPVLV